MNVSTVFPKQEKMSKIVPLVPHLPTMKMSKPALHLMVKQEI